MQPLDINTPEESLGYVMGRTFMRLRHGLRRAFQAHGHDFTPEQWSVLSALSRQDGLPQCELGERTVRDKTTITRILDRLEGKGLLERRPHGQDRRSHLVFLTAKGREFYRRLLPVVEEYRDVVFNCLSEEELAGLRVILEKITAHLS